MLYKGDSLLNFTSESITTNTTTQMTLDITPYSGYETDGLFQYDGEINGNQVFTEILGSEIEEISINELDLSKKEVEGIPFVLYAKENNSSVLRKLLDSNKKYVRKYIVDEKGKVAKVSYVSR